MVHIHEHRFFEFFQQDLNSSLRVQHNATCPPLPADSDLLTTTVQITILLGTIHMETTPSLAVTVTVPPPTPTLVVDDQAFANITYSGSWTTQRSVLNAFNETLSSPASPNSSFQVFFGLLPAMNTCTCYSTGLLLFLTHCFPQLIYSARSRYPVHVPECEWRQD